MLMLAGGKRGSLSHPFQATAEFVRIVEKHRTLWKSSRHDMERSTTRFRPGNVGEHTFSERSRYHIPHLLQLDEKEIVYPGLFILALISYWYDVQ